jgi:hypothetical protein
MPGVPNEATMSSRAAQPTAAPRARASLDDVLRAGFQKLCLEADATETPYGSKRSSAGSVKSNVEALGLELNNLYFPSVRAGGVSKRLGPRLSTVTLLRTNTGTAPGVVYDDNATVLIISADSGYGNKYLDYLMEVRAGKTTAELPNIQYSFPTPQNRGQPSAYVKNARAHLLGLVKEATLESIGQAEFSRDYEQPLSKIYVFFKRPVTGSDALRNDGPYIYFGRFKALNDQNMIRVGMGNEASSFTDSNLSRITSIGLKPFDIPAAPMDNPRVRMSMPNDATGLVEEDIDTVIRLLQRMQVRE